MLVENILLPGVVYPIAAAAVGVVASLLLGRGGQSHRSGASIALGAAFATGYVSLAGWPRWPPVEATQRLAIAATALALLCFVVSVSRPPEGNRNKLSFAPRRPGEGDWRALLGFGLFWTALSAALLENLIRYSWSTSQTATWLVGLLALGCLLWLVLRAHLLALPEPHRLYPGERDSLATVMLRIGFFAALAAVLGLAESALLGQLFGVVVCGLAVLDLCGWLLRRRFWRSADLATLAVLVLGLLLISHHYAGLSLWPALLATLALLLLPRANASLKYWLLPLLPVAAAIALLAWAKTQAEDDPYGYEYGATSCTEHRLENSPRNPRAGAGARCHTQRLLSAS